MAKMKPHKLVIACIQSGGATAEKIMEAAGLNSIKELNAQFKIIEYLDLYAVPNGEGVYSLLEEDEYDEWKSKHDKIKKVLNEKQSKLRDLDRLLKKDPHKKRLDLELKRGKALKRYNDYVSKNEDKATEDKLIQLRMSKYDIEFCIADEEFLRFGREVADLLEIEECLVKKIPDLTDFVRKVYERLNKVSLPEIKSYIAGLITEIENDI